MNAAESAAFLGITPETLTDLVRLGILPTATPASNGEPMWSEDQILKAYDRLDKKETNPVQN